MTYAVICFFALQVLDIVSTCIGLSMGAQEYVPFMRMALEMFPGYPSLALALAKSSVTLLFFLVFVYRKRVQELHKTLRICNAIFAAVVCWNIYNLAKLWHMAAP